MHPRCSGKVVSAGINGEIVQWQAFFFDPATGFVSSARRASGATAPPPAAPLKNNSLVGLINERRNRNEDKIQRNLRSRDPAEPTLRRVGHEAPRGDGRVGGVDVFEMDYRVRMYVAVFRGALLIWGRFYREGRVDVTVIAVGSC